MYTLPPIPSPRLAGNSIVPFTRGFLAPSVVPIGRAGAGTVIGIALKSPWTLFALVVAFGLIKAAQYWGQINGAKQTLETDLPSVDTGVIPESGVYELKVRVDRTGSYKSCAGGEAGSYDNTQETTYNFGLTTSKVKNMQVATDSATATELCTAGTNGPSTFLVRVTYQRADGTPQSSNYESRVNGNIYSRLITGTYTSKATIVSLKRDGVTVWTPKPAGDSKPRKVPFAPFLPSAPPAPILPPPDYVPGVVPDAEPIEEEKPKVPVLPPALPAKPPGSPPFLLPIPGGGIVETDNGKLVPLPKPALPQIPPDWHYPIPGGPALPGNGPQPTLEGVAQEVGRIEQKLQIMLDPNNGQLGDTSDRLQLITNALNRVIEAFFSLVGGGTYSITAPCEVDANGDPIERTVSYAGALNALEVVSNKVDALAELMQAHKDIHQPMCRPTYNDAPLDLVTVNFRSLENSAMSDRPLRKQMRYADWTDSDVCVHANHWEGFEWQAGPYRVISEGLDWANPQCWALTPDEGKRVIAHAAAVAGVDLTDPRHKWNVLRTKSVRLGQVATMQMRRPNASSIWVVKRDGSSGRGDFPVRV